MAEPQQTTEPAPGTGTDPQPTTTTEPATPAPATGTEPTTTEPSGSTSEPTRDDLLAEIDKWKGLSRKNEGDLRKAQSELDTIRQSQMSDQEKAIADARAEGAREVRESSNRALVSAEIRAAAAGVMTDPADAVAMIGLDQFLPEGEAEIDSEAIKAAIGELVTSKPYLAVAAPKPPPGNVPGGPTGGDQTTFTRSQIADPEFFQANETDIMAAAREGRIRDE